MTAIDHIRARVAELEARREAIRGEQAEAESRGIYSAVAAGDVDLAETGNFLAGIRFVLKALGIEL